MIIDIGDLPKAVTSNSANHVKLYASTKLAIFLTGLPIDQLMMTALKLKRANKISNLKFFNEK